MNEVYTALKQFGDVKLGVPLAKKTTFKIGGPAQYFITTETIEKTAELLAYLDGQGVAHMVLGGGSNMLAPDDGYEGVIVHISDKRYSVEANVITVAAGMPTVEMAQVSIKEGLCGFEWGVGIPGTIGGAVRGNAGAMGFDMNASVLSVDAYIDGRIETLTNEQCGFRYRESIFKENGGVILRVRLALKKAENTQGMKEALSYLQYRNKTQPQGFASTGCIFKNVDINIQQTTNDKQRQICEKNKKQLLASFDELDEKVQQFLKVGKISAGWLVEQVKMKGVQVGQAKVSDTHGNFIVNLGGATAHDVYTLIEEIKTKVYDTYGMEIEEEIQVFS